MPKSSSLGRRVRRKFQLKSFSSGISWVGSDNGKVGEKLASFHETLGKYLSDFI